MEEKRGKEGRKRDKLLTDCRYWYQTRLLLELDKIIKLVCIKFNAIGAIYHRTRNIINSVHDN